MFQPIFPRLNRCGGNSHFVCKLPKCESFFIPLDLDEVAECLYARRQGFTRLPIGGNMASGHPRLALCNTQQEYSPPGEDILLVDFGLPDDGLARTVSSFKSNRPMIHLL